MPGAQEPMISPAPPEWQAGHLGTQPSCSPRVRGPGSGDSGLGYHSGRHFLGAKGKARAVGHLPVARAWVVVEETSVGAGVHCR